MQHIPWYTSKPRRRYPHHPKSDLCRTTLAWIVADVLNLTRRRRKDLYSTTHGRAVKAIFDTISAALQRHESVSIKGLGCFEVVFVKERGWGCCYFEMGNVGSNVVIPAHYKVVFTPDPEIIAALNKGAHAD